MDKFMGKRLDGRYQVSELVGVGGMANVYKAKDLATQNIVAVKILRDEYASNVDLLRRFKNESKAISVLSHPNIVKVYDVNFSDRVNYIVMEYIDGVTLKEYIEHQGVLKWKDAVYFAVQILRALQHAHDNGIVHRDIKPQNIMLMQDGSIKVTDFGIARFARSGMHTVTDKAIGSVHYISPEQARGDTTDNRSDIYSTGVIMFEMLTGQLPFEADSAVSVAIKQIEAQAQPPRAINPEIPQGLESIVVRAMQKDPRERYQSAAEMLKDIDSFKRDPSISFEYKYRTPSPEAQITAIGRVIESSKQESAAKKATGGARMAEKKRRPKEKSGSVRRRVAQSNAALAEDIEQEQAKSKGVLPILAGVTAAFVLGTLIFVGAMFALNNPFERVADITVPTLVGANYESIKNAENYKNFNIQVVASEHNPSYANGVIYDQEPSAGRTVKIGSSIKVKVSLGTEMVAVPDIIGKEASVATKELEQMGLEVSRADVFNNIVPVGYVISVEPGKGSEVPARSGVKIQVSMGPNAKTVVVPDLGGKSLEQAKEQLADSGLKPGNITYRQSASDTNTVVGQSPGPSSEVSEGSYIDLTLSSGDQDIGTVQIYVKLPEDISSIVTVRAVQDGETVMERQVQPSLVKVWKPTFNGSGQSDVQIYIDNELYQEYTVNFEQGNSVQK